MLLKSEFTMLMNLPVLMLNSWYFFMIIYSVFYMYVSVLTGIKQGIGIEDIRAYTNPIIFLLYQCAQLYSMVLIPSIVTGRGKKMLRILNSIKRQRFQRHVDCLLEVCMIDSLGRNYDITNYGMYAINRSLLFGMIATMTSYVIILVQFHMQDVD
ncbi:gustatory and pheromone receptor 39a-like [Anopheles ziemanni]|uniref:gustatory and pheromone receptor 39a-like n=1 Tax=Anopheles coustani TaxID=139045 RepID=UPI002659A89B|nr:gustatory and pheromone receptor 39a-like [Anopheles coustani]XP_058174265.1 gustatory and pheromone receptor 39a-like [Anopheles ziemanni]